MSNEDHAATLARVSKGAALATAAAIAPHSLVVSSVILGLSELTGPGAGGIQSFFDAVKAKRVKKTVDNLSKKISEESIDINNENIINLFAQAVPYLSDASTENKRKMMEDIIMNGARRHSEAVAQIEAATAITFINEMPDGSCLIFAEIVSLFKSKQNLELPLPTAGLNSVLLEDAQGYLYGTYKNLNSHSLTEDRPALIIVDKKSDKAGGYFNLNTYKLTKFGEWLADWINENPLSYNSKEIKSSVDV